MVYYYYYYYFVVIIIIINIRQELVTFYKFNVTLIGYNLKDSHCRHVCNC
jgi:hypothetical protein